MADMRIVRSLDELRAEQRGEERAALNGIATYTRASHEHATRHGSTVPELLEVLRNIEMHARAVLGPGMLPAPTGGAPARIPAPRRETDQAMSVERCVAQLFDPAGHIGRMRIDQLLALAIDGDDVDELLLDQRVLPSRCVASLPLPDRARLAAAIRDHTRSAS